MNNLPTTHRTNTAPAVATVAEREVLVRYSNALDWNTNPLARSSISSQLAPTDEHRALLAGRRRALADALIPASSAAIGTMIASLRSVMPSHDNSDPVQIVAMYRSALSRFPEWAVAQVCRAFLEGRAGGSTTFAPTPADIASRCEALVQPHKDEQEQIGRILEAEVRHDPSEDERERVARGLRELAASIGKGNDDDDEERVKRAAAKGREISMRGLREELERHGITDSRPMSLELRQQVAAMRERRERQDEDGTTEAASLGPEAYQEQADGQ